MKFPWYIWISRILIIIVILFMALFSFDVFEMKASFWQKMLGLFMHNIPGIILLLALVLTWKRPLWAGIILAVLTACFSIWIAIYFTKFIVFDLLAFALPVLIAAGLFILAHYKRIPTPK